jgi:hypothetical protein
VAVAIDDALNCEASRLAQAELQRERDRLKLLLDVNSSVSQTWSCAISFEPSRQACVG